MTPFRCCYNAIARFKSIKKVYIKPTYRKYDPFSHKTYNEQIKKVKNQSTLKAILSPTWLKSVFR